MLIFTDNLAETVQVVVYVVGIGIRLVRLDRAIKKTHEERNFNFNIISCRIEGVSQGVEATAT